MASAVMWTPLMKPVRAGKRSAALLVAAKEATPAVLEAMVARLLRSVITAMPIPSRAASAASVRGTESAKARAAHSWLGLGLGLGLGC